MIDRIRIVSVPVSDQAKAFYVNTLGFELLADEFMDESGRWIEVPSAARTSTQRDDVKTNDNRTRGG